MKDEDRKRVNSRDGLEFISDPHEKDAKLLLSGMFLFIIVLYIPLIAWIIIFIITTMDDTFFFLEPPMIIFGIFSVICFIIMVFYFPMFNTTRPGIGVIDSVIIKRDQIIVKKGVMRRKWKMLKFPISEIFDIDINVETYFDRQKKKTSWFKRWISQRFTWKPDGAFNWYWFQYMRRKYCLLIKLNTIRRIKEPYIIPMPPSYGFKQVEISEFIIAIRPGDRERFIEIMKELLRENR